MDTKKSNLKSPDLVKENFEKLAALFPNCVTEGKAIDFDLYGFARNRETKNS